MRTIIRLLLYEPVKELNVSRLFVLLMIEREVVVLAWFKPIQPQKLLSNAFVEIPLEHRK